MVCFPIVAREYKDASEELYWEAQHAGSIKRTGFRIRINTNDSIPPCEVTYMRIPFCSGVHCFCDVSLESLFSGYPVCRGLGGLVCDASLNSPHFIPWQSRRQPQHQLIDYCRICGFGGNSPHPVSMASFGSVTENNGPGRHCTRYV